MIGRVFVITSRERRQCVFEGGESGKPKIECEIHERPLPDNSQSCEPRISFRQSLNASVDVAVKHVEGFILIQPDVIEITPHADRQDAHRIFVRLQTHTLVPYQLRSQIVAVGIRH